MIKKLVSILLVLALVGCSSPDKDVRKSPSYKLIESDQAYDIVDHPSIPNEPQYGFITKMMADKVLVVSQRHTPDKHGMVNAIYLNYDLVEGLEGQLEVGSRILYKNKGLVLTSYPLIGDGSIYALENKVESQAQMDSSLVIRKTQALLSEHTGIDPLILFCVNDLTLVQGRWQVKVILDSSNSDKFEYYEVTIDDQTQEVLSLTSFKPPMMDME